MLTAYLSDRTYVSNKATQGFATHMEPRTISFGNFQFCLIVLSLVVMCL